MHNRTDDLSSRAYRPVRAQPSRIASISAIRGGGVSVGGDRQSQAFAAWRFFFEALAEQRPLVLVFEDLHRADEGLLDFVDYLVGWAGGVPLLVAGCARPELLERRPGWGGGKPNAVTLSLAPLSDDDTARLIGSLLGRPMREAGQQAVLLAQAGGNPLYAEQYVQMLAEQQAGPELPLPESIQGIIGARLDLLAPPEKRLLQDAAVVGKVFWPGAVAVLGTGTVGAELEERLHGLERKQFIRREPRSSVVGETQYAFAHVLVRDVAYGQIPRAARVDKHLHAAGWIESLGRPVDQGEMLAHHYLSALELARAANRDAADLVPRARSALHGAGDRAMALNALSAAAGFYRAALGLWGQDAAEQRADLLFRLALALRGAGEDEDGAALEQARSALLAAGDRARAAEAEARLGELWWLKGHRDRQVKGPQALYPVLAVSAYVLAVAGPPGQARRILSELFRAATAEPLNLYEGFTDCVLAALILGRRNQAGQWLGSRRDSPWLVAAHALADQQFVAAAELLDSMGAARSGALARLHAAQEFAKAGQPTGAEDQLRQAQRFFQSVGAAHFIRQGQALLAASA